MNNVGYAQLVAPFEEGRARTISSSEKQQR